MAYHGYIPFITQYAYQLSQISDRKINILEIGLLYGVTTSCISNNLNMCNISFDYHGVDLRVRDEVKIFTASAISQPGNNIKLYEMNSINAKSQEHKI